MLAPDLLSAHATAYDGLLNNLTQGVNGYMSKVRVAIVGVGNCAASLVQGVEFYKDTPAEEKVPGLMHVQFGDYHVSDVEFVAAFDVDAAKVGTDLADAIEASRARAEKRDPVFRGE